ncbi:pentatricopeptide repeat protein [Desulfobotulus alkaliphilus]|uniref:Pentatricopeptide repeat protein n=1 Tax=Desulfobotulus alkaliphilus TaxID=622671 RepID=A0A562RY81_9BACT|nr:cyclic nucleotide-binding domain-containing protein [Desulfobotulus alkaliphilus]TWI74021.1 pentatricopeptide repeat protein [Desulfobotulus alkaliphilus]
MKASLKTKEDQVKALLAADRREDAMNLLFALVKACAAAHKFDHAERLYQQMMDVDALAIDLVVRAAELIEEEKNRAIDRKHLHLWKNWYNQLKQEERSAFFFATSPFSFSPGDVLFRKGEMNDTLFFVDEGALNLVSVSDTGQEVVLRRVGPGSFAGEETFYKSSVCTSSLVALMPGEGRIFTRNALLSLSETLPGLGPKLRDFTISAPSEGQTVQAKGINRRSHKRIPVQGSIVFQPLGQKDTAPAQGRMADISQGGLSFYVKTANGQAVRQLLGNRLGMKFLLPHTGNPQPVVCKGEVTGVLCHMDYEYSIHVKFDSLLDAKNFT